MKENPSAQLAEGCGRPFQNLEVSYAAAEAFVREVDPSTFDRLILLGVATGRSQVCVELLARNWYGSAADTTGVHRQGPIEEGLPLLLGGTAWREDILADVLPKHRDLRMSLDAGSYLCNFIYFKALNAFQTKPVGFVHVAMPDKLDMNIQMNILQDILARVEG